MFVRNNNYVLTLKSKINVPLSFDSNTSDLLRFYRKKSGVVRYSIDHSADAIVLFSRIFLSKEHFLFRYSVANEA